MTASPASGRVPPRLPPDTPLRIASHCAAMYAKGAVVALSLHRVARYASRSKRLCTLATRCVVVNGVMFLGSLAVLDHALAPFMAWVLARWTAADAAGGASGASASSSRSLAASAVSSSFLWTARAAWLYPTYFASTVVNSFTAGEIARISCALAAEDDGARARARRRRETGSNELDGWDAKDEKNDGGRRGGVAGFAEAVYHVLIVNSLFAQITALSFVLTGTIGRWITRALQTWLYAYYCHDYLWSARGKPARWRLSHFEGNWCYYAGFGSPIVLISALNLSTFYASAVQAMAFPVFMIAAIASGGEGAEVGVYGENGGETTRQGTFPVFHLASASARAVLRLAGAGGGSKGGGAKRTKGE